MQDEQKPPSFPSLPKSALFSKLDAFLPVMAEENKKLSEAVAAGEGAKHNIEVEEAEQQADEGADDAMAGNDDKQKPKDGKAPVIEMVANLVAVLSRRCMHQNFALGMMDEGESEVADAALDPEAQIKAATVAKVVDTNPGSKQQEEDSSFRMRLEKPSSKPRPVIQELN
ncbi:hypothetical protein PHYPSEUDO_003270 [Phytophthora pseudosyringae]|uniref:Uncharacterized protein n=1 Tax=Phytophthora pseudosyringae TaxID=221518 RepID=A0A8T1VV83_9STRA|nr:hypothetical protein PHYPSEUDO_003270 [Phytophthora pseudosyringae]